MQQRIRRQPFLDLFDGADPNAVTGVRPLTTTALQALYTMNDPFFHEQADALAVRVGMAYGSDAERLNYAFSLLYGRAPDAGGDRATRASSWPRRAPPWPPPPCRRTEGTARPWLR